MGWQAWFTLALVAGLVAAMARGHASDLVMLGGLTLLLTLGIVVPEQALVGFSNEGVLAVAALFVLAAGIRETGALDLVARRVLGRPRAVAAAQIRMMLPMAGVSAFVNNTPIVAVAAPLVADWARRIGMSPSKLLIPLSYATILGGTCSLIGTSTNLVVSGLARGLGLEIGLFEIAWVGVPALVTGLLYVLVAAPRLLPDRGAGPGGPADPRAYGVTMRVEPGSAVVGLSIEAAGLRHLTGLFLAEIAREGELLPAAAPETVLRPGDQLLFVGVVGSVAELRRVRGLVPVDHDEDGSEARALPLRGRRLVEAVVAPGSSLVNHSVRESRFRTRYDAAVIAVHRRGERVPSKLGDIVLEPGDTLLLEARPGFLERHGRDPDFALAAEVAASEVPRHDRAGIAAVVLLGLVVAHTVFGVSLITAALLAAGAMVATRCLSAPEAVRSVDLRVVVTIAASFGVGEALASTGVAATISAMLVEAAAPLGPVAVLAGVYLATALLTELITNNAAAVLMFPIAAGAAQAAGLELRPFAFTVMMAASASFSTPIGYQTNLMVWGPGGYRFSDFVRFGVPLQVVLAVVSIAVISWRWL